MHALPQKAGGFLQSLLRHHGAYPAASIGNNAVGAEIVAAVFDLQQGPCAPIRHTGRQIFKAALSVPFLSCRRQMENRIFTQADHRGSVARAAYDIDLLCFSDALRIDLRKTAARGNHGMRIFLAQLMKSTDIFVVRYRGDRAGVNNDSVSTIFHNFMPTFLCKLL